MGWTSPDSIFHTRGPAAARHSAIEKRKEEGRKKERGKGRNEGETGEDGPKHTLRINHLFKREFQREVDMASRKEKRKREKRKKKQNSTTG